MGSNAIRTAGFLLLAVAGFFVGLTITAGAQEAKGKIDPKLKTKHAEVMKILRDGDLEGGGRKSLDDYFNKYFFHQFVSPAPPFSLNDLPKTRKGLALYFSSAKSKPVHDLLAKLTVDRMRTILQETQLGEYDEAIKYNAVLMLAELNDLGSTGRDAKPAPVAFPLLLEIFKTPEYKDYLKVAALIGLNRFAATGTVPDAKKAELTQAMLDLVNQATPPSGRDAAAHNYLRRSAAQVLVSMGDAGPNNAVAKALAKIAADPKARPVLRCEIAQMLGQLQYPAAAKPEIKNLANDIGHQTVEIVRSELEAAKVANRPPMKRLVLYSLFSAKEGVNGLRSAADGSPSQEFTSMLAGKLQSLYSEVEKVETEAELADVIGPKISDLESVLVTKSSEKEDTLTAVGVKDTKVESAQK